MSNDLEGSIVVWAMTQDAGPRAATLLLVEHNHWLHNNQFVRSCVGIDGDTHYVDWDKVKERLDKEELTGTGSELALLWFAWNLYHDTFTLTSLDVTSRQLVVDALAYALGVMP